MSHVIPQEIPTVNYHLWKPCNMRCGFCFATFDDLPSSNAGYLPKGDAIRLVDLLCRSGFSKINFAGGEPTLCPWLIDLVNHAKSHGVTTSIVTNGSRITGDWLDELNGNLDIAALSIDSIDGGTLRKIGRAVNGNPLTGDDYQRIAAEIKQRDIRLKVNTVVSQANCDEDLRQFIRSLMPERWKIFQALSVQGQNDKRIDEFAVTPEQFEGYVQRNRTVAEHGVRVIPESNELMTGSYIMVDPLGRFFDNTRGRHQYSPPILDVGVDEALKSVAILPERFVARGGWYD